MKRLTLMVAALMACVTLGSAAWAQTPAQIAKYNRYLRKHPAAAAQLGTNPVMGNVPSYMTNYTNAQNNYNAAYQAKYQKNLATYENYMATHPGVASPYASGYSALPSYGAYAPTQQLASSPIMGMLSPFLGNYGNPQNYGYSGVPMQPSYPAAAYGPANGIGGGYGPYGSGYGPYGGYGNASGGPMPYRHRHFHHHGGMFGNYNGNYNNIAQQGLTPGSFAYHGANGWRSRAFAHHWRWGRNH